MFISYYYYQYNFVFEDKKIVVLENRNIVSVDNKEITYPNLLIVPSLDISARIYISNSLGILNEKKGVVMYDNGANPLTNRIGENIIIAGHRFQYLPPNTFTFFNLINIGIGKDIYIRYMNKMYLYTVEKTEIVPSTESYILSEKYFSNTLILYTCTPLWSDTDRFVVISKYINKST